MSIKIAKVTQTRFSVNGKEIWLPSPLVAGQYSFGDPDPYTQTSNQLYPLGTRLEYGDGRVFRYGCWGGASSAAPIARLVGNMNLVPGTTGGEGYEGTCNAGAVGDEYVDIDDTDNHAENYFEDGMLAVYPSGHYVEYRIIGSDAYDTHEASHIRVYLDTPLKTALVAASTGITAYRSKFSNLDTLEAEGVGYVSAMGVCLATAFSSGYYGWIQRRGDCIITPTAYFGDSANERAVFYNPADGTIGTAASYDPSSGYQCIGYLIEKTESGYGDLRVFLTLE